MNISLFSGPILKSPEATNPTPAAESLRSIEVRPAQELLWVIDTAVPMVVRGAGRQGDSYAFAQPAFKAKAQIGLNALANTQPSNPTPEAAIDTTLSMMMGEQYEEQLRQGANSQATSQVASMSERVAGVDDARALVKAALSEGVEAKRSDFGLAA